MDKLPPHSIESEIGVLGCMILDPKKCIPLCIEKLNNSSFYDLRNRDIYIQMISMFMLDMHVDQITLVNQFKSSGMLDRVGGVSFISSLPESTPSSENVEHYIGIVQEKHNLRRIIQICQNASDMAFNGHEYSEVIGNVDGEIKLLESGKSEKIYNQTESAHCLNDDLEYRFNLAGNYSGIKTGFGKLDNMLDGVQYGEQTLVGARPSGGKTSLGVNIIKAACYDNKIPSMFVTYEMSVPSLMRRLLSCSCRIPIKSIKCGTFTREEQISYAAFIAKIKSTPIYFIDAISGIGCDAVCSMISRMCDEYKIKLVVIDYLQCIPPSERQEKKTYEVGSVSKMLKATARSTGAAFLTLAQLNREPDKDKGRMPKLSDFADSSQIERDADTAILIHRPRTETDPNGEHGCLVVAKQRDGATGLVPIDFIGEYCLFENPMIDKKDVEPFIEKSQPKQ